MSLRRRPFRIAPTIPTTLTAAAAMTLLLAPMAARPAARQTTPPRIVAVGDIHGAYDAFVQILQAAGVIDAQRQWIGGTTLLVQTGDVFDRGTGVRSALDLLMDLEDQAKRAGGRVEALLGNHEVMNLASEYRDVNPETYAAFADARSEDRQKRAYDDYARIAKRVKAATGAAVLARDEWMKTHPPGFVEYVELLGPRGKYGKWLRAHEVIFTANGTGFMHAGISPDGPKTIDEINKTAARELDALDDTRAAMVQAELVPPFCTLAEMVTTAVAELQRIAAAIKKNEAPGDHVTRDFVDKLQALTTIDKSSLFAANGPLWFRGFAQWPDGDEPQAIALLERYGLQRFVTAHTPQPGRIRARFGNRMFIIDTGMLSSYFKNGRASALELHDGRVTAIYSDSKEVLVPSAAAHFVRLPFADRARAGGVDLAASR
jgi:hypothetical protein